MDIFCRYSEIVYKKYLSVQIYFQNGRLSIRLSQFYHQLFTIIALLCFSIQRQTTFLKLNIVHDRTPWKYFTTWTLYKSWRLWAHQFVFIFYVLNTTRKRSPQPMRKARVIVTQFKNITFFVLVGRHQISKDN